MSFSSRWRLHASVCPRGPVTAACTPAFSRVKSVIQLIIYSTSSDTFLPFYTADMQTFTRSPIPKNNAVKINHAEAMVCKELPKHVRDLIVGRYDGNTGTKPFPPGNTVKAIITKWRKWSDIGVTLRRTGCPSKIDRSRKNLSGRLLRDLEELQEYLVSPCTWRQSFVFFTYGSLFLMKK